MADLQQLLSLLGIQGESQGPGIGDFPLGPRTPVADINRRALFETRSALRQRLDPLPAAPPPVQQGLQAPAQIPQLPRGQGMMGAMSLPRAAAQAPAPQPMAPDREPWRQPASTATWAQGMPSTGRGMEPPSAAPGRSQASIEDEAWNAALERARGQIFNEGADPTRLRREASRELGRVRGGPYVGNYSRW